MSDVRPPTTNGEHDDERLVQLLLIHETDSLGNYWFDDDPEAGFRSIIETLRAAGALGPTPTQQAVIDAAIEETEAELAKEIAERADRANWAQFDHELVKALALANGRAAVASANRRTAVDALQADQPDDHDKDHTT